MPGRRPELGREADPGNRIGATRKPLTRSRVRTLWMCREVGGEGGIRTHGTVARTPHFECGAFDHSATSPQGVSRLPEGPAGSDAGRSNSGADGCQASPSAALAALGDLTGGGCLGAGPD